MRCQLPCLVRAGGTNPITRQFVGLTLSEKGVIIKPAVTGRVYPVKMIIKCQKAIKLVKLLLLINRHLNEENVPRLDVFSQGIDRHHLASSDGHAPILGGFLDLGDRKSVV